jgi:hypothetical protein
MLPSNLWQYIRRACEEDLAAHGKLSLSGKQKLSYAQLKKFLFSIKSKTPINLALKT